MCRLLSFSLEVFRFLLTLIPTTKFHFQDLYHCFRTFILLSIHFCPENQNKQKEINLIDIITKMPFLSWEILNSEWTLFLSKPNENFQSQMDFLTKIREGEECYLITRQNHRILSKILAQKLACPLTN